MKKKTLFALLIGALLPLTSCSLFNDDDLAFKNEYHVAEEKEDTTGKTVLDGVIGVDSPKVENCTVFKDLYYGNEQDKIVNTYKEGGVNENQFHVNGDQDFAADPDENNYDLYVPAAAKKNEKHLVMLFIHGGAWVSGLKTDVNQYVHAFAEKGYITATIKYTLLNKNSLLTEGTDNPELSIFRDLDEIDACIASIKKNLATLGFDTTKTQLAIGGGSSGSHLTMLYGYSRGQRSPLPISFLVNVVGPTDITPDTWLKFKNEEGVLEGGIDKTAIDTQRSADNLDTLNISFEGVDLKWNEYQTMRVANGMCGFPYTSQQIADTSNEQKEVIITHNEVSDAMTVGDNCGEKLLSVTRWITKENRIPIVSAYAGKDRVVGINQYATLQAALEDAEYPATDCKYVYFQNAGHTDINEKTDETAYGKLLTYINDFALAALS
ncbi:MAG: alpha/beta hydrolase [Bacilli bacterium]|nr:alpha/beta hydrolase [Bacilli bacterium]